MNMPTKSQVNLPNIMENAEGGYHVPLPGTEKAKKPSPDRVKGAFVPYNIYRMKHSKEVTIDICLDRNVL